MLHLLCLFKGYYGSTLLRAQILLYYILQYSRHMTPKYIRIM